MRGREPNIKIVVGQKAPLPIRSIGEVTFVYMFLNDTTFNLPRCVDFSLVQSSNRLGFDIKKIQDIVKYGE